MKKYVLMLLANYLPVLFAVLFYRGGAPLVWPSLLLIHFMLAGANERVARSVKSLFFLSANLLLSTVITHALFTYLYCHNVSGDQLSWGLGGLGMWLGIAFVLIFSISFLVVKHKDPQ